jgi:hypothetical protein
MMVRVRSSAGLEHRICNPEVAGPNPAGPAILERLPYGGLFFLDHHLPTVFTYLGAYVN